MMGILKLREDRPATIEEHRALREALAKLSNEVIGSLPLMEAVARQAIGNANYTILMMRAEEARALLRPACTESAGQK